MKKEKILNIIYEYFKDVSNDLMRGTPNTPKAEEVLNGQLWLLDCVEQGLKLMIKEN